MADVEYEHEIIPYRKQNPMLTMTASKQQFADFQGESVILSRDTATKRLVR